MFVGDAPAPRHLGWLALTAIAWFASPTAASGQEAVPWPIKEFQVVAVEPAGVSETGRNLDDLVERMARIIRTETDYDPDFPLIWDEPTVSLSEATKLEIQDLLHEAALKLESWGFPPPALDPIVRNEVGADVYRVYLVTDRAGYSGIYHIRPCSHGTREAVIVLDADDILDGNGLLKDFGAMAAVHELVHAVQASFPPYDCGDGRPGQWIGEGTAEAIGWDVVRQQRGFSSLRNRWERAWGARLYSEQLPVPGGTGTMRAYRTSAFWRFLAEYNRSRPTFPGPGASWPVDYGYLTGLLGRDLNPRDCYDENGACDAELRWIDAGLRAQFGLSLRELYARFVQAYALYGEGRVHSTEGGSASTWRKKWLWRSFAPDSGTGCTEVLLDRTPEGRQRTFNVSRFVDVAAQCWEIELDGYTEDVVLAVTATYRPGSEAVLAQLTAVMADGSSRVDDAAVRTVAGVPETTWYYDHVTDADPALFLLTNLADEPDATRGLANLSVTFTALDEYVAMGVSGDGTSGSGAVGDPTPADIAQPLDFEVAEGDFTVFYVAPGDAVADNLDLDHPVCQVWLKLRSPEEDALWVMGNMSAPIRPVEYSIVNAGGGEPDLLGSRLWTSRTAGRGRLQAFGKSGRLELDFVDHLMVEGTVWTHVHQGLEGGDVNLMVRAEFGLQPGSMVGGILGPKASDHPCFVEGETPTLAGGTGGGNQNGRRNPSDGRNPDGRNGGDEDDRSDEDDGSDDADEPDRGGLPAGGRAEDVNAPADTEGPPSPAGGEAMPSGGSNDGEPGVAGSALRLEFLDREGATIRSRPQEVRGAHSSERVDVSASSVGLQLALHQDAIWQCTEGKSSGLGGIYALTGLGMSQATAIDWDGWYRIDIRDAQIEMEADAGAVRLELDFEHCQEETGPCQSGIVVVRADPGDVRLASTGEGSTRVDVSGATLEAELNRQKGACDGLVDFSATLRADP